MLRYFFIFYFFIFLSFLPVSAQETAPAPFLGNPMEKALSADTVRFPEPPQSEPSRAGNDNFSATAFSGWNVGPPPVAPSNGTLSNETQKRSALESPNSNIGNIPFATPLSTINPNYTQNFYNPQLNPPYNPQYSQQYGQQEPQYDYNVLAAQYAAQLQNYYQNNFPAFAMGGASPAAGNFSNFNNANNFNNFNNANNFSNANMPRGDLFSNMMMSGAFEQNPALYQAMLQQEELRHQQSLEEEEEREREAEEKEISETPASSGYMPHIAGTLFSCIKTVSPFNTPTGPDRGVGMPLLNRSWLDRPFYAGGFVGKMSGSKLVSDMIDQKNGADGGLIVGFNINDYWGLDGRLHFASLDIEETAAGKQVYQQWYAAQNAGALFVPPLTTRTNQLTILDLSVHYYPLGNAKFRPFFKYGIGAVRETFRDTYGVKRHIDTMAMPFGVGLKYWWNERLAIQMDIVDNIIFSRDITKTQNNWAFSVGVAYSFGSSKKRKPVLYYPYTSSSGSRR